MKELMYNIWDRAGELGKHFCYQVHGSEVLDSTEISTNNITCHSHRHQITGNLLEITQICLAIEAACFEPMSS